MRLLFEGSCPKDPLGSDINEDRRVFDAARGALALCDGASESFNSSVWAQILADKFVANPAVTPDWLAGAEADYVSRHDFESMSWSRQASYQRGSFSALLGIPHIWEDKEKALYHSTKAAPSHFYMAQYLWARAGFKADAIVHYGTHGSQEWLPGKERGLSMSDYPMLPVGNVPVVYPYIVDNIGEALQVKRRGRAVTVTHQTPPFAPAGLHDVLTKIHDLLHAWLSQDEGSVKVKIAVDRKKEVKKERIGKDMGWSDERIEREFPLFINELHDHLHELAQTAQPLGLHTFGTAPPEKHRLRTVLLMLGKPSRF